MFIAACYIYLYGSTSTTFYFSVYFSAASIYFSADLSAS